MNQSFKLRKFRAIIGSMPNNLHKVHGGDGFGALGPGGAWGSLSFDSFLSTFPLSLDAFAIGVGSCWGCNGTEAAAGTIGTS